MCYNCGCGMPDDDMGNPDNITEEDFKKAAEASGQSIEVAKQNILELLQKEVSKNNKK